MIKTANDVIKAFNEVNDGNKEDVLYHDLQNRAAYLTFFLKGEKYNWNIAKITLTYKKWGKKRRKEVVKELVICGNLRNRLARLLKKYKIRGFFV